MGNWYQLEAAEVLRQLEVDASSGLNPMEVSGRQLQFGANELVEQALKSPWRMIWEQLTASTIVILLVAALVSAGLGDYTDTGAILAIVALTTLIGFNQEYRAGKAIAALKKLAVPRVKVCRAGQHQEISAYKLVPGDIVLLESGSLVPADCRLLETANLRVQESALTGEVTPIEKTAQTLPNTELPLGDRRNMVFMGTTILYGRGRAVVVETGMNTELGRIAHLVQAIDQEPTPLQQRLERLGQKLVIAALGLTSVIFGLGILRGESLQLMFLTAVSMAVGVVPEGLPAIVTITLAIGAQRMLKRQVLIRRLPAVETLGSVTVICADKTGTLTENRMTVTVLETADQQVDLTSDKPIALNPALNLLLTAAALCNDTVSSNHSFSGQVLGDPTEVALILAAARFGLQKATLECTFPRIAEIPFDSDRKRMTTVHQTPSKKWKEDEQGKNGQSGEEPADQPEKAGFSSPLLQFPYLTCTKGAVVSLLEVCSQVWVNDRLEVLDQEWRDRLDAANHRLAQSGARVLGIAVGETGALPEAIDPETLEQNLVFVGLIGMADPARPEVKPAVEICKTAGISPVLITGDHPLLGQHIAQQLGIAENDQLLTSAELNQLALEELTDRVEAVSVYARVSPEQKLKIVQALQNRKHIVAMTGDGINDAPALRKADIGIAMGKTGTDVAKEAADMVLLDDNFASIVAAVREGRVIYDNIRKSIKYLLSGNAGEIWVMLFAPLLGMPLPLLPIQILWINLVADGLPALALGVEMAEPDAMHRSPSSAHESILGQRMAWDILWIGLVMGLVCLGTGYLYWLRDSQGSWQTMLFTVLTLSRMGIALAVRSDRNSLFQIGLFSNLPLLSAVVLTFGLQLAVIYIPLLQTPLQTIALSWTDLGLSLLLSTLVFWAMELQKWLIKARSRLSSKPE